MSKLILFDFECCDCGTEFEELAYRDHPDPVKCPRCHGSSRRLITGTRIDPRLGVDATSFPTMGDAWARKRRERAAIENKRKREHGADD